MSHQCMMEVAISIETCSVGAGRDVASMVEVHCYATPIYNLGKCPLTDEFFRAFANLILLKEIQILESPCCSTREDLSIDVSITNVWLILTKLWWLLFSGYGQMDRHGFGILIWRHVGTQKISTQSSKLVVSCRSLAIYMPPRRTGMHKYMTRLSKLKIIWRRGKQYTSPVTLGRNKYRILHK